MALEESFPVALRQAVCYHYCVKRLPILVCFGFLLVCPAYAGDGDAFKKVSKLIPELGAKDWNAREEAQEKIFLLFAKDASSAVAAVAAGFVSTKDPEIAMRLDSVLKRMAPDHVRLGERGFLGVSLGKLHGAVKVGDIVYEPVDIIAVLPGTTAALAGLTGGERILSIDDINCTRDVGVEAVVRYISSRGPGGKIRFVNLMKDKKVKARVVVLGDRPKRPDDPPLEDVKKFMMEEWLNAELRRARRRGKQSAKE